MRRIGKVKNKEAELSKIIGILTNIIIIIEIGPLLTAGNIIYPVASLGIITGLAITYLGLETLHSGFTNPKNIKNNINNIGLLLITYLAVSSIGASIDLSTMASGSGSGNQNRLPDNSFGTPAITAGDQPPQPTPPTRLPTAIPVASADQGPLWYQAPATDLDSDSDLSWDPADSNISDWSSLESDILSLDSENFSQGSQEPNLYISHQSGHGTIYEDLQTSAGELSYRLRTLEKLLHITSKVTKLTILTSVDKFNDLTDTLFDTLEFATDNARTWSPIDIVANGPGGALKALPMWPNELTADADEAARTIYNDAVKIYREWQDADSIVYKVLLSILGGTALTLVNKRKAGESNDGRGRILWDKLTSTIKNKTM